MILFNNIIMSVAFSDKSFVVPLYYVHVYLLREGIARTFKNQSYNDCETYDFLVWEDVAHGDDTLMPVESANLYGNTFLLKRLSFIAWDH